MGSLHFCISNRRILECRGKGPSVWDMNTRNGEHVRDGHSGHEACDHYHRSEADIALFSQLGINAYRFFRLLAASGPRRIGSINKRASISTTDSSTSSSPSHRTVGYALSLGFSV